ncbi:hypothetical protein [Chryseobacterium scophthalmum]|uniref:hypothetical protein n=1 Tax=Chryseobacterium scophthalmum TaxID=59733 RepID=UPI001AEC508F|nr:hypothetical protein [Chryseobacterium scophthalmum]
MKIYRIRPYSGDNNVYIESTGFNKTIVFENLDGEKINEIKTFNFTLKNKTKNYPDLLGTGSSEFFVSNELKTFLEKNITKQKINLLLEKNNIGF